MAVVEVLFDLGNCRIAEYFPVLVSYHVE
jgi:hypothetical protein